MACSKSTTSSKKYQLAGNFRSKSTRAYSYYYCYYYCHYYFHYYCYHYVIINNIIGLYSKVQWQGLGVVAKLWLLDFNYCQNNKAQWKNLRAFLKLLDTITGYLLFLFIYLFIYLFIFSVNKFILTTVKKNFL